MSIYTKAGDTGLASTITKSSIPKNNPVFEVLGTLDELNCHLGIAKTTADKTMNEVITTLQQDLISLCAQIAGGNSFLAEEKTKGLENTIDDITKSIGANIQFVLPGKTKLGANLHAARAVARRAERTAVALSKTGGINRNTLAYLNRLSDLLYMLANLADSGATHTENTPENFLQTAQTICNEVIKKARIEGVKAVVAVSDAAGDLIALARDEGAYSASVDIAMNKAYTSAS